jgi:hypothetical protein
MKAILAIVAAAMMTADREGRNTPPEDSRRFSTGRI